jgi:hypothetical protein
MLIEDNNFTSSTDEITDHLFCMERDNIKRENICILLQEQNIVIEEIKFC